MKNFKYTKYLVIAVALVGGFLVSNTVNKELFIANTPQLRPMAGEYVVWRVRDVLHKTKEFAFFWDWNKPVNTVALENYLKSNLKPIAKGVRAAEEHNMNYTKYTIGEVECSEVTYTLSNGKVIKVKFPKGLTPPPQDL